MIAPSGQLQIDPLDPFMDTIDTPPLDTSGCQLSNNVYTAVSLDEAAITRISAVPSSEIESDAPAAELEALHMNTSSALLPTTASSSRC